MSWSGAGGVRFRQQNIYIYFLLFFLNPEFCSGSRPSDRFEISIPIDRDFRDTSTSLDNTDVNSGQSFHIREDAEGGLDRKLQAVMHAVDPPLQVLVVRAS